VSAMNPLLLLLDVLARRSGSLRFSSGAYWEGPKKGINKKFQNVSRHHAENNCKFAVQFLMPTAEKHIPFIKRHQRDTYYQDTHVYVEIADESINDDNI
jgi:hypothetical protein